MYYHNIVRELQLNMSDNPVDERLTILVNQTMVALLESCNCDSYLYSLKLEEFTIQIGNLHPPKNEHVCLLCFVLPELLFSKLHIENFVLLR